MCNESGEKLYLRADEGIREIREVELMSNVDVLADPQVSLSVG